MRYVSLIATSKQRKKLLKLNYQIFLIRDACFIKRFIQVSIFSGSYAWLTYFGAILRKMENFTRAVDDSIILLKICGLLVNKFWSTRFVKELLIVGGILDLSLLFQ